MRTKSLVIVSLLALMFARGTAYAECDKDYSTTLEANQEDPQSIECPECREISYFKDMRNAMINYMGKGNGLNETLGLTAFGLNAQVPKTLCNGYGQCATATMQIKFREGKLGLSAGVISTALNVNMVFLLEEEAIETFKVAVALPNGDSENSKSYFQWELGENAPLKNVPADNEDDGIAEGTCLDNSGETVDSGDGGGKEANEDDGGGSSGGGSTTTGGVPSSPPPPGYYWDCYSTETGVACRLVEYPSFSPF